VFINVPFLFSIWEKEKEGGREMGFVNTYPKLLN
jgi:hypothetical protein